VSYWAFTVTLIVLGIIGGYSIGPLILPIGAALILLGPVRRRPRLFWPAILAVTGFQIGFLLYAPLSCATTSRIGDEVSVTVCRTILGPEYRGTGLYNPPLEPARWAGAVVGVSTAAFALVAVLIDERRAR
jgi:hypothetical protein